MEIVQNKWKDKWKNSIEFILFKSHVYCYSYLSVCKVILWSLFLYVYIAPMPISIPLCLHRTVETGVLFCRDFHKSYWGWHWLFWLSAVWDMDPNLLVIKPPQITQNLLPSETICYHIPARCSVKKLCHQMFFPTDLYWKNFLCYWECPVVSSTFSS